MLSHSRPSWLVVAVAFGVGASACTLRSLAYLTDGVDAGHPTDGGAMGADGPVDARRSDGATGPDAHGHPDGGGGGDAHSQQDASRDAGEDAGRPTCVAPSRAGMVLEYCDTFPAPELNLKEWTAQRANLRLNVGTEAQAYLPNQYLLLNGGGLSLVATKTTWGNIGGTPNGVCSVVDAGTCEFSWVSANVDGATMLATGWGYKEFGAKLPAHFIQDIGPLPQLSFVSAGFEGRYVEIDVAFEDANDPTTIYMQLQYGCPSTDAGSCSGVTTKEFCAQRSTPLDPLWQESHTFGIDWEADSLTGYIDGQPCSLSPLTSVDTYIPQTPMFPSMALAVSNEYTLPGPFYLNVDHYYDYVSVTDAGSPTMPPAPFRFGGVQTTAPSYEAGTAATIAYTVQAGDTPIGGSDAAIGGTLVYIQNYVIDYVSDTAPSYDQGSTVNAYFGLGGGDGFNQVLISPPVPANKSAAGSVEFPIDAGIPSGVYTAFIGLANVGQGVTCPLVIGNGQLPPAPTPP